MKNPALQPPRWPLRTVCALCLLALAPGVRAQQQRVDIEQVQATTVALIETLVESGIITREKADQLFASAKAKAQAQMEARARADALAQAPAPEVGSDGKRVVRVPFVPDSVKREMREQIKEEVLAQARTERWGEPAAYPSWMQRLQFEGDFRIREEMVRLASGNSPAGADFLNGNYSRAADIAQSTLNGLPNFNTQNSFDRMRIRARLGVTATLSDTVTAALRLSTGNTTDRTSTNQTLGQFFNKYTLVIDQAHASLRPFGDRLLVQGGRMPNPFFSTDLVWAEDLGFEGVSVSARREMFRDATGFLTAGYFPLSEDRPGTTRSRSMVGVQTGVDMKVGGSGNRLKFGLAVYDFGDLEGRREVAGSQFVNPEYAARFEYPAGLRQRGNTLFNVRAPGDNGSAVFGLASRFRELNVTAALDMPNVLPQPLRITGDFVKNLGFDRASIASRTGSALPDGKDYGFMARVQLGKAQVAKRGDWNVSLAYRYLGSDAVLDAFTNSDFGLGGTNNKGFILGMNYGLYDNTVLSLRWLSANPIDSYAPGSAAPTRLSVDTVQLELSTRF